MREALSLCALFFAITACTQSTPPLRLTAPASNASQALIGNANSNSTIASPEQPIQASDISDIKPSFAGIPTDAELIQALKQDPVHLHANEPPITLEVYNSLSLKMRQIIALLVNRGILQWDGDKLYDYNNQPTSLAMVQDYINRLDLFLAAYLPSELGTDTQSSTDTATTTSASSASGGGFTAMTTLGIAVGLITAVGTLIWGYREWTGGAAAIKAEEDKLKEAASQKAEADAKLTAAEHQAKNAGSYAADQQSKTAVLSKEEAIKAGGKFYDPGSAKFGKYVFSSLLVATGFAVLGLSVYQIVDAAKQ